MCKVSLLWAYCHIVLLFKKCERILEGFVSKFNIRVKLVVLCIGMCVFKKLNYGRLSCRRITSWTE